MKILESWGTLRPTISVLFVKGKVKCTGESDTHLRVTHMRRNEA